MPLRVATLTFLFSLLLLGCLQSSPTSAPGASNVLTATAVVRATPSTLAATPVAPVASAGVTSLPSPAGQAPSAFHGTVLAGTSAPLLDFNKADYEAALRTDKLVVVYFYASWCPICAHEEPQLRGAFNEVVTDRVVGFRVHFNDDQTDDDARNLAREHGVAYQHTKVFVRNGQRVLKSSEVWEKARYLSEINSRA